MQSPGAESQLRHAACAGTPAAAQSPQRGTGRHFAYGPRRTLNAGLSTYWTVPEIDCGLLSLHANECVALPVAPAASRSLDTGPGHPPDPLNKIDDDADTMLHAPPLQRMDAPPRLHLLKPATEPAPANPLDHLFDVRLLSRRRVLILDYDGTLAPLRAPGAAGQDWRFASAPYEGTRELLARLRAHPAARVVFVSGRPAREMEQLLALSPRPEIFGVHGWEHLSRSGQLVRAIVPAQARARLDELRALHAKLEAAGAAIEDKHAAIAIYWRGRSAEQVREIRALLAPFEAPSDAPARLDGVFLQPFDGGIELRAHGPSKGSIVRSVLREESRDAVVAYFGDDLSDEEAFRAIAGRGIGVRVLPPSAAKEAARRATAAQLTLRAPDELHAFLARWTEQPGQPAAQLHGTPAWSA